MSKVLRTRVLSLQRLAGDAVILRLRVEGAAPSCEPSQFFMLSIPDGRGPLLPRPFSIYRSDDEARVLEFLVKMEGTGTRALAALTPDREVLATGPLGCSWPEPVSGQPVVLVAGGVGIVPFPLLMERARARGLTGDDLQLCFAGRSAEHLYDLPALEALGFPIHTATQDGSLGQRGLVTELLEALDRSGRIRRDARYLVCGPDPMMQAVRGLLARWGAPTWFSLETYMGCGVGVCNGCSVPIGEHVRSGWPYAKACVDGPVFSGEDLTSEVFARS